MRRSLSLLVGLAGCGGVPENEFIVEYEAWYCTTYRECATPEMLAVVQERECFAWYRKQEYPENVDCRYDGVAAEACLELLPEAGCDGVDPALPASCEDAYNGCPFPRLPLGGVEPLDPGAAE